ncbi:MAG: hypothetical protein JW837_02175 [Sedimentisphaerales bacterium]|nr:hypothetical protein [Sedimentisphaerales bacterium]
MKKEDYHQNIYTFILKNQEFNYKKDKTILFFERKMLSLAFIVRFLYGLSIYFVLNILTERLLILFLFQRKYGYEKQNHDS